MEQVEAVQHRNIGDSSDVSEEGWNKSRRCSIGTSETSLLLVGATACRTNREVEG
jgi:hypothetical protein